MLWGLGAKAQPLHVWWTLNYKVIARDTGVQLIPWKLSYPMAAGLPDESVASWFDKDDSLQYLLMNASLFTKHSDSVIFDAAHSSSCWQGSSVYHDRVTDTVYFIGKQSLGSAGYKMILFKIHPNRKNIDVIQDVISENLEESLAVIKCTNGKIWAVAKVNETDTWVSIDLKNLRVQKSILEYSKTIGSLTSNITFHPSGKLLVYNHVPSGYYLFPHTFFLLNFDPSSGALGYRSNLEIQTNSQSEQLAGMCFDSSGRNLFYTKLVGQNIEAWVFDFEHWLTSSQSLNYRKLNQETYGTYIPKFTHTDKGYIYLNTFEAGYALIINPSVSIDSIQFIQRRGKSISDKWSFDGGQEATIKQIHLADFDTITFFNSRLPLTTEAFYIPDAFTPSGDYLNDGFGVYYHPLLFFSKFSLTVFNRWGGIVFHTDDPEMYWDGNYKGKPCPEGTYCYTFRYQIGQGEENVKQGCIQLLRRNDE